MSHNIFVVLDNVRSAWNVGSIIRTCDAIGAQLVLVGYTPRPTGQTLKLIEKTSIGAEKTVKFYNFDFSSEVFEYFDNTPPCVHLAIEISEQSQNIYEFLKDNLQTIADTKIKLFLWFGNEIHGLNQQVIQKCKKELHLPMKGMKESLNISNAVTATLYLVDCALTKSNF
jgi:23S rRNA (guanosine2251-2'-O)-methyltransferase